MTRSLPQARRIVVIGAGLAGLAAVQKLRADGFDGQLTLIGAEHHLPYSRPPLSKAVLAGAADPADATSARGAATVSELADVRLGHPARAVDFGSSTVRLSDEDLGFDRLLIASGVRARTLAVPGAQLPGVHLLRTLDDCAAITAQLSNGPGKGSQVVVIGAGFIGCEVAATLAGNGCSVTLIEPAPQPLLRALGPQLGALVAELHRSNGVHLRLGTSVRAILGLDQVSGVELSDGSVLNADLVVVGVGAIADTEWLEGSGLKLDDGIVADEFCEASVPGVFVAGDVARFRHLGQDALVRIEHWTNAGEQGSAAAANLLREADDRVPFVPLPYVWSDQFGRKIQIVGFTSATDPMQVFFDPTDHAKWLALQGRAGRLSAALGCAMPARVAKARALIAAEGSLERAVIELTSSLVSSAYS